MKSVARRISDRHVLHLIKQWLRWRRVDEEDGRGGRRQDGNCPAQQERHPPRGADLAAIEQRLHAAVSCWVGRRWDMLRAASVGGCAEKHKTPARGTARFPDELLYQKLGLKCLSTTTRNLPWAKA